MVMKEHIVASFDDELNELSQKIAEMGGIAEQQVADSVAALARRDGGLAQSVIASDRRMDQLQVKVGRGEIEYGRIVTSLQRYQYAGSLAVEIEDAIPGDLEVETEVRKLGLLLESLL